jgi:hypothetical protein
MTIRWKRPIQSLGSVCCSVDCGWGVAKFQRWNTGTISVLCIKYIIISCLDLAFVRRDLLDYTLDMA